MAYTLVCGCASYAEFFVPLQSENSTMEQNHIITISKEAVAVMPIVAYPGKITLVDTPVGLRRAIGELREARVVGFDTETRPSFHRGRPHKVALMQLSTEERCYLVRINVLGFPEVLKNFLEDAEVIKIGLSVHDDVSVMRRLEPDLDPQGFIDLQEYVKYFGIGDISLQKVYAIVFGERISKTQRLTNWEAAKLTEAQQVYAAIDAWACLRIYRCLRSGGWVPGSWVEKSEVSLPSEEGEV